MKKTYHLCLSAGEEVLFRDIEDYNELKTGLTELYADLQIDTKSDVYVVLPNVHFGFISFATNTQVVVLTYDRVAK